jgi:hypothetical protein
MRAFFINSLGVLALAPWVYMLLICPMAWVFFDLHIAPANFYKDWESFVVFGALAGVVWSAFLLHTMNCFES